ncbi:MAG: translation elongation factor Ts [Actinobacteria bacterium]|nr:translation elongation factor Ts [Actinomycetota bacterium]
MAEVSAKEVAALRKQTGAGMMDCKRALEESGGDLEAAKDWLRKKGLSGAAKREGREADEGAIDVVVDGRVAALVEVNCETDFVAKGDDFKAVVGQFAAQVAASGDTDVSSQPFGESTVAEEITQLGSKLGEKMQLGRVIRYETDGGLLDGYKHVQNNRGVIGVLVELDGVDPSDEKAQTVAHDIALHIASAAPRYVSRDDVPADAIEKERVVLTELTRNEGKPENAIERIVEGRLNGFYRDYVLLEQGFVREPKTTVAMLVEGLGAGAAVKRFARVKIGEE